MWRTAPHYDSIAPLGTVKGCSAMSNLTGRRCGRRGHTHALWLVWLPRHVTITVCRRHRHWVYRWAASPVETHRHRRGTCDTPGSRWRRATPEHESYCYLPHEDTLAAILRRDAAQPAGV